MSAAVLNKAVDKITDNIGHPGAENKASTLIKAICISTDKKSLKNSKKLVAFLDEIIKGKLPSTNAKFKAEIVQENYKNINENLTKINAFLEVISKIFDSGHDIEMDEDVMLQFLANVKTVQKQLVFISDYLGLVLQVQSEKKAAKHKTSFADLISHLNAA